LNVLLVSPTNVIHTERQNWSSPPLGIWRIAGWLEPVQHVEVWDTILDEEPPRKPCGGWDLLGFSVNHDTLPDDLHLMRKMGKEHPHAFLLAGGVEASTNYQQLFEEVPRLQGVILGEGEQGMLDLCNGGSFSCEPNPFTHSARGLIRREYEETTLNAFTSWNFKIPFERMRYPEHWAITKKIRPHIREDELYCVRLNTSTYCDRACPFCSMTHVHSMAAGCRVQPLTMTGEDTKELVRKVLRVLPEVQCIYWNDDDFCLSREKAETFFEDPPALRYLIQARVDTVDRELLQHIARGGCKQISYGVENWSRHVLQDIGKGVTPEQADEAIALTQEAGMDPIVLIMLFCPTSTMEDMVINYRKLLELEKKGILISIMSYVRAYHGTRYLKQRIHEILWDRKQGITQPFAVLPDDPEVRQMWVEFESRVAEKQVAMKDQWKCRTSTVMIGVLEELLRERGAL